MSQFKPLMLRVPMLAGKKLSKPIGLGDVVKRVTTAVGVRPCGGCNKRAQALNRWVVLTPPTKK
jgi:hypothetical protein